MADTPKIFISHSWSYKDAYHRLVTLLNARGNFLFSNFSVPKGDPIHNSSDQQALYNAIYNQIRPASIVLIMAGVCDTHSKWIQHEVRIAKNEFHLPKPIIVVKPWAQASVSVAVSKNANELVGWNTESVVGAIRKWG